MRLVTRGSSSSFVLEALVVKATPLQGPSAAEKDVRVLRDELRSVKQQLDDGTRQLRYQHK